MENISIQIEVHKETSATTESWDISTMTGLEREWAKKTGNCR